jgi:uncharacterized protein (DUF1330 family)
MFYVIAHLSIISGMCPQFRDYECSALAILRRHGGELVTAFAPERAPLDDSGPDEIHVIRFADRAQFEAFRADSAHQALSGLRAQCVRKTTLYLSETVLTYEEGARRDNVIVVDG